MSRNGEIRNCKECKKEFFVPYYEINRGRGKGTYCSRKCRNITIKEHLNRIRSLRDISKRKPLPHAFKKGQIPWNKGLKGCFSKETIEKIRNFRLQQILPTQDTSIEIIMKKALDRAHIKYEHPYNIGNYIADFAIPKMRIVIECDGAYWHSLERNKRYDVWKEKYYTKQGWRWVRFLDMLINTDMNTCIEFIKMMIQNQKSVIIIES